MNLTLIRQARQGFTISGEESNVRLLMEFITQKELTEYDMCRVIKIKVKHRDLLSIMFVFHRFNCIKLICIISYFDFFKYV